MPERAERRDHAAPLRGPPRLDDLDRQVLRQLQDDARITIVELAHRLKLSAPGLQKRMRKLEQRGAIERYATIVNRKAVGLDLLCFVQVLLAHHRPDSVERFPARIRSFPKCSSATT